MVLDPFKLLLNVFVINALMVPVYAVDNYQVDDNAIYHLHQGQMWMESGQYKAAAQEYEIAIALKPETIMTAALYNDLGIARLKLGQTDSAMKAFEQAVRLNPGFEQYLQNLANANQSKESPQAFKDRLTVHLMATPQDASAWYLLGRLHEQDQSWALAQAAYQQVIATQADPTLTQLAQQRLEALKHANGR